MFIARMMPKSYIYEVQKAGGFSLILRNQHYPLLADELAARVRNRLSYPFSASAPCRTPPFGGLRRGTSGALEIGLRETKTSELGRSIHTAHALTP